MFRNFIEFANIHKYGIQANLGKSGTIHPVLRNKSKIFLHFVVLFNFCCNFAT